MSESPWEQIDPVRRDRIEEGERDLERIDKHETFYAWLRVGQALLDMQDAAMRLAGANKPVGKGYNAAYKQIANFVPKLARLDTATKTHAMWVAANKEAVEQWHAQLPSNVKREVNHPSVVKRHYEKSLLPPKAEKDSKATNRKDAEIVRLQEELDAANDKIRNMSRGGEDVSEGRDWTWQDKDEDIARSWLKMYPAKAKRIAEKVLELSGARSPRTRTKSLDDPSRPRNRGKVAEPESLDGVE